MRKNLFFISLLTTTLFFASCGSNESITDTGDNGNGSTTDVVNINKNTITTGQPKEITRLEFPKVKGGTSEVIVHSTPAYGMTYASEWDHTLRSQRWSCFEIYKSNNKSGQGVTRKNNFLQDSRVNGEDAPAYNEFSKSYYPGTNDFYDKGHICASADRFYDQTANDQTFYMTNMQPQVHIFNANIWGNMEDRVRSFASNADTLYVCKGGTIDSKENILSYTKSGFIVPRYFFMAVLAKNSGGYKAMGFWVEHLDEDHKNDNLGNYVVNIDDLEQKTGIDFFCNLPDDVENQVESLSVDKVKIAWGF